ncbi:MAG: type I 3-dehydroquinate dehydratase [Candidatus Bilamarchaeum sp.]|jgi:3-dehydroquinate dehydratase-1
MICLSIANISLKKCLSLLKEVECAEIRLDKLKLTEQEIVMVFSSHKNLIATNRKMNTTESVEQQNKRVKELEIAINSGAAFVDLDIEESAEIKKHVADVAKKKGTKIIISYHNFDNTPPEAQLIEIVQKCNNEHVDLVKIACQANNKRDSALLLGLLGKFDNLLVIGMGEKGQITRIVAPLLGSKLTFASISKENTTASGQMPYKKLKKIMSQLEGLE